MTQQTKSYPQTYTTIANALKYVRYHSWNSSQLWTLDRLIDELSEDFSEINPRFNAEQFKTMAHYYRDRNIEEEQQTGRF